MRRSATSDQSTGHTAPAAGRSVDGERTIRYVADDLTGIDFLPDEFKAWAADHQPLLELIVEEFQASGSWPAPEPLTRKLVRRGRPTPVDDIVWRMPRPLGWVEHNPDQIVLSLFGLRCTEAAVPLLEGFVRVLRTAIERYATDDENPMITKEDVASIAAPPARTFALLARWFCARPRSSARLVEVLTTIGREGSAEESFATGMPTRSIDTCGNVPANSGVESPVRMAPPRGPGWGTRC